MEDENYLRNMLSAYLDSKKGGELTSLQEKTAANGIILSEKDYEMIVAGNKNLLKIHDRFEFGKSAAIKIAEKFSESAYADKKNFAEMVTELTDFFYDVKNAADESVNDEELIEILFDYFENRCGGSIELLTSRYAESILNGESIEECDRREFEPDDFD